MSYSRWYTSKWYTYFNVDPKPFTGEAVFSICSVTDFTYTDLQNISKCLQKVKKIVPDSTPEDLLELKGYMKQFLEDVKEEAHGTTSYSV